MPTIVMTKGANKLEPEVKKKAYAFLEKLADDDTTLGLHIEPITNSADPRVRTGRVDQFYRAVLFKIPQHEDNLYVFHGIFPHDEAIAIAKKTAMTVNPVNGVTEIRVVQDVAPATEAPAPGSSAAEAVPVLQRLGFTVADLIDVLGIDEPVAARAVAALDEDELLAVATADGTVEWQGLALLDLAAGHGFDEVKEKFDLVPPAAEPEAAASTEDEQLVRGLQRPAAKLSFTYIGDDTEELRRVIEGGDFGAWRVFLHPEQRRYAERPYNGPFRLAGGAGTGKTVVILHRARNLARREAAARVLVTTFTTNLADAMKADLQRLDPALPLAATLGEPGVYVTGIDALASAVLRRADDADLDVQAVLGATGTTIGGRMTGNPWGEALDAAGAALPETLRSEAFLEAEYNGVILPHRITGKDEYLKVRRPGRGVALDRGKRSAVWDVVAACRAQARVSGGIDFPEACAIAAAHLARVADSDGYLFDHVLVDEGQDLAPTHWQLLRALVGEHANDLFIAEDAHQRIYGRRVVLSQFGIKVVGRSRRLTLNYRTTAQNLDFAMKILHGGEYLDLEDGIDPSNDYRSARSGPPVRPLRCTGLTDELDTAARVVEEWAVGSTAPETIAVLVRDRRQRDRVAAGLAERGVPIRSVDREQIKPGQPVVMTMHRAKGTEFRKVLLFDVSEGAIPAPLKDQKYSDDAWEDALLRERSLVYVAATRARDELALTYNGKPSSFVTS